ncbi:MAG: hypothetical protein F6K30_13085, partial [Cyanothece sp. SIO2G6]|nr:hypothetical protein [Cyanothece sp. SIO2G6]
DGDDRLRGTSKDDHLDAGAGDDDLIGRKGNDTLLGGLGDDSIQGRKGDDTLIGGLGDDRLQGGNGNDILDGGLGSDGYNGGSGADTFVLQLGEGRDFIGDFRSWQGDTIALADGLTFEDLTINRYGADGARVFAGDDYLAIVLSTSFSSINTESAFTTL